MNHDNFTEVTDKQSPYSVQPGYKQGWATGYNTCLSRTNAAELLECLTELVNSNPIHNGYHEKRLRAINAIKKATDESR